MRHGVRIHGGASCNIAQSDVLPAGIYELSCLYVPEALRNDGRANKLLNIVCSDADKSRCPLAVMVDLGSPIWLVNMYEKHGFEVIQNEPCIMARRPKAKDERR